MTAIILLSFIPTELKAAAETKATPVTVTTSHESAKDNVDLARLNEIKAMDMSTLSRSDKKELRKEVREIKNDQDVRGRYHQRHGRRYHDGGDYNGRRSGGTVYFMGGGGLLVLILILLLI